MPETIDVDSTKVSLHVPSGMAVFPWVPRDWNGVEHKTEMINNHKTRFSSRLILLIPTQTISSAASADVQERWTKSLVSHNVLLAGFGQLVIQHNSIYE